MPNLTHAVINRAAQRALKKRRNLNSILLPNVFDFNTPAPNIDSYNSDFRQAIGLTETDWLILQPTRVIPRKGIELAIQLVARLDDPRAKLIITHYAGDEGLAYWQHLQKLAQAQNVDLRYVANQVDDKRGTNTDGQKIYTLWDTYPHANLITYPSLYEGFGNALIETIYFRQPALVNRYPVYVDDIAPLGFQFAEINGQITNKVVQQIRSWLENPAQTATIVDTNYQLAQKHFSYDALAHILKTALH